MLAIASGSITGRFTHIVVITWCVVSTRTSMVIYNAISFKLVNFVLGMYQMLPKRSTGFYGSRYAYLLHMADQRFSDPSKIWEGNIAFDTGAARVVGIIVVIVGSSGSGIAGGFVATA